MKKEQATGKLSLTKITVTNFTNAQSRAIVGGLVRDSNTGETNCCDVRTTGTDLPSCWYECPETSRVCSQTSCDGAVGVLLP
jgi:hypothetical protein